MIETKHSFGRLTSKGKLRVVKKETLRFMGRVAAQSEYIRIFKVLFRRPARSWSTRQLISIYTELSLMLHTRYRTTEKTNLKFQKVARVRNRKMESTM